MSSVIVTWTDQRGTHSKSFKAGDSFTPDANAHGVACTQLHGLDEDGHDVIYFSSLKVLKDSVEFSVANDQVNVEIKPYSKLRLELCDPIPKHAPESLNHPVKDENAFCWVHLFGLNRKTYKGTFKGTWKEMPKLITEAFPKAKDYCFSFIPFGVASVAIPFVKLEEVFTEENLEISWISFIVYYSKSTVAIRSRQECEVLTSEGIPEICHAAIAEVLKRENSMERSDMRRIFRTALCGGLTLDLLYAIGWDRDSFRHVLLNLKQSSGVNLLVARRKFSKSDRAFDIDDFRSEDDNEECFKHFWLQCIKDGIDGTGLELALNWQSPRLKAASDVFTFDAVVLMELEAGQPKVPLILIDGQTEVFFKSIKKMLCSLENNCRLLAERLLAAGKDPSSAMMFGFMLDNVFMEIFVACPQVCLVNGMNEIVINISRRSDWHFDLVTGTAPFMQASLPNDASHGFHTIVEAKEACLDDFLASLHHQPLPLKTGPQASPYARVVERIYVPYPRLCDLAVKALYFVFEGIAGCAKEIKDAPVLANSVPFRKFDDDDDI